jgi:hypothetical protein
MTMSEYNPDKWVMLKFESKDQTTYKILASWAGSYLSGQSWKLNSGCTRIEEDGQCYLFHGSSGSVYRCHKAMYGMTGYTHGIYANFHEELTGVEGVSMEMMPEDTNFMALTYG